jgi:hypothetical protein
MYVCSPEAGSCRSRESYDANCDIGDGIFVEPHEGKNRIKAADFISELGYNHAKVLRDVRS